MSAITPTIETLAPAVVTSFGTWFLTYLRIKVKSNKGIADIVNDRINTVFDEYQDIIKQLKSNITDLQELGKQQSALMKEQQIAMDNYKHENTELKKTCEKLIISNVELAKKVERLERLEQAVCPNCPNKKL